MYTQDEIEATKLNGLIDEIVDQLSGHDAASDEYAKMADQLTKLYKLKQIETELKLKTNDQDLKSQELYVTNDVKERDSETKLREVNSRIQQQMNEHDLRKRELDDKLQQIEVEVESKKDEIARRKRVSPETLALIAANLTGIIVIIGYERANVIASKALGFVNRLK